MGGYSKVRVGQGNRSRSIDFSDLSLTQFSKENPNPVSSVRSQGNPEKEKTQKVITEAEGEEEDGERFGAILSRNMSVSAAAAAAAAASRRLGSESQSNVKSVVGRAFSMRRSSSVGEGYCRIHNQCEIVSPPPDNLNPSGRSGRRRMKLLKACKKLFRLF
ncbi:hypothetical protein H6P81_001451 [Aristolochia fimbriata]|uniref:Uncharacterized protein n=1 Tax=Aristolochia fimbriata TaxID=158543 RepID=A0AAV7F7J5_ARIFI|nr:hypothetical protein H6P81_001451 [Aristolochia fimbriata]